MSQHTKRRRLVPDQGPAYELWDASALLLGIALVGYVLTTPPTEQAEALSAPLEFLPDHVWGVALCAAALVGVACSYQPRWLRLGYMVMLCATAFWAANFAVGFVLFSAEARSLMSVMFYAWLASRLYRDKRLIHEC